MDKKIKNINADGWLDVFDLLPPQEVGLQIAPVSKLFCYYVDEHFKTRRWTMGLITIGFIIVNGTKEMQIVNGFEKVLPIPGQQVSLPKKVIGFKHIYIRYIDQNVLDFLHHLNHLFASGTFLCIATVTSLGFIMHNFWPLIRENIRGMHLTANIELRQMRQFVPSFLNDCPSLRLLSSFYDAFPAFPSDDSANATDGQLVAKWLFSPPLLQNEAPKMVKTNCRSIDIWTLKIDGIKAAFTNASSPANFFVAVVINFDLPSPLFELTNQFTGERLTLKTTNIGNHDDTERFLLVRCPISRDEQKWAKWEEEAKNWIYNDQQRIIDIVIEES